MTSARAELGLPETATADDLDAYAREQEWEAAHHYHEHRPVCGAMANYRAQVARAAALDARRQLSPEPTLRRQRGG